jgi:hypothetical protein
MLLLLPFHEKLLYLRQNPAGPALSISAPVLSVIPLQNAHIVIVISPRLRFPASDCESAENSSKNTGIPLI